MGKLLNMFMVLIAIQGALLIYHDSSVSDTSLWSFITNLITNWTTLELILAIGGISVGISIAGIVAGSVFGFKTDFIIFAPVVVGLISIGIVFKDLADVVYADLAARIFGCAVGATCMPATYVTAFIVGPVALYYVWMVIEWWRGKDY